MFKKILHSLMALTLAAGFAFASTQDAEARRGFGTGVAVGVLGLFALGAAAHAHDRGYYRSCYGPERCAWRGRRCFENRYGDWVCRGGRYSCWRPNYCD